MIITESEKEKYRCPLSFNNKQHKQCLGHVCMSWVWTDLYNGYCGFITANKKYEGGRFC